MYQENYVLTTNRWNYTEVHYKKTGTFLGPIVPFRQPQEKSDLFDGSKDDRVRLLCGVRSVKSLGNVGAEQIPNS